MNLNLQLKIKKAWDQASGTRHLNTWVFLRKNLKLLSLTTSDLKQTKTFYKNKKIFQQN